MRRAVLLVLLLVLWAVCLPAAGQERPVPPGITITANPTNAHIGDTIHLNGTVTGINTIAVYLFVTGPGLDSRGVSLENLNIAAGRGLFTTAPVIMYNGTWTYTWDTSVIVGNLKPGTYSVYVVASPLDRLRSNPQEMAVAQVRFTQPANQGADTPLPPALPVAAVAFAGLLFCTTRIPRK